MFRLRPIAAILLTFALLPACTATAPTLQMTIQPYSEIKHSTGASNGHYERGKHYQMQGKRELAMASYEQALKLDRRHAEARNALATMYSEQGRYAEAESLLREGIAQSPAAAYLHNNLGYIYFLQGKQMAAIEKFRTAISLDRRHEWAGNNLARAEAALDLERRAAGNTAIPPSREATTTIAAFAVWDETQLLDANVESTAIAAARKPRDDPGQVAENSGVVAHVRSELAPEKPVANIPTNNSSAPLRTTVQLTKIKFTAETSVHAPVASVTGKFRLELANGNGITGFAKRMGEILGRQGITVHRLTNQPPYRQATTVIQYKDGFEREAEQIKNTLRGYAIVERADMSSRADVRVVIGKDIRSFLRWPRTLTASLT